MALSRFIYYYLRLRLTLQFQFGYTVAIRIGAFVALFVLIALPGSRIDRYLRMALDNGAEQIGLRGG